MIHLAPLLSLALLAPPQDTGPVLPGRDPRQEIRRLFQEVERELSAIDVRLADAGAGEIPLDEVADSGLEKLLQESQQSSRDATAKMDRILELAVQMSGQKGGGGSRSDEPSPLDRPQDGTPLDRESTPEAPRGEEQQKPEPGKEGEPSSPSESQDPGRNRPGEKPRDQGGDPAAHPDDSDPWGFLPQRAREVFRNQGTTDMPVQYRDWIDSYYRRLNATRR
jgi:hypothetical protein